MFRLMSFAISGFWRTCFGLNSTLVVVIHFDEPVDLVRGGEVGHIIVGYRNFSTTLRTNDGSSDAPQS